MIASIVCLVMTGIFAGPLLARFRCLWRLRTFGWACLLLLVACAHFVLAEANAVGRMAGICAVLLGGMKGLVYAEWARGKRLPLTRYLIFALAWFGMDPGTFQEKRKGLLWKGDVVQGLTLMVIGTLGAWLVWRMEWRQILLMFVPMSLGFHFGALRVLKGVLRAAGFPVRTLFPNVLLATGFADFWSRRWNVGYSQMMQRLIGRPLENRFGESVAMMAVFIASGLLHELAITLPVRAGFGLPTLYFLLHGMVSVWEKRSGRSFGKIPALLAVMLPLGLLFPPAFQNEVIAECLKVFQYFPIEHLPDAR